MTAPKIGQYLILILILIGILHVSVQSPGAILFPVCVGGIIYYLYKRPPRWLTRLVTPTRYRDTIIVRTKKEWKDKKRKRKNPFKVV